MAQQCKCEDNYVMCSPITNNKPICSRCGAYWSSDEPHSEYELGQGKKVSYVFGKRVAEGATPEMIESMILQDKANGIVKQKMGVASEPNEFEQRVKNLLVYIEVELAAPNASGGEALDNAYLYDEGYNDCLKDLQGKLKYCLESS